MNLSVLYNLSYGMYIVGAFDGNRPVGCVINTCIQITSEPPTIAISLNKNNYTLEAIRKNKRFSISILSVESDPLLISVFGFQSSRTADKYADFGYTELDGTPIPGGMYSGRLVAEAKDFIDCGTHVLVVASLIDTAEGDGIPMTYKYYHDVIKGRAPKNAPTYMAPE